LIDSDVAFLADKIGRHVESAAVCLCQQITTAE